MNMLRICLLLLLPLLGPTCALAADVQEAPNPIVEGIDCNGNLTVSCDLIRARSGISVGKELNEAEIDEARLRLEALPNMRAVHIHLIKGSRRQWVVVVIDVTEVSPLTTAFAIGTLAQIGGASSTYLQTFAGRVTDHDLFGSGKTLDLAVVGAAPIGGGGGAQYATRLEYLDPALFDSRRYFLTAGLFYTHAAFDFSSSPYPNVNANGYQNSGAGFDLSLGVRFDSAVYASVGYRYLYLKNSGADDPYLTSDGVIETLSPSPGGMVLFTVGRDTEDDPSFPTRGWLLHLYDVWQPWSRSEFGGVVARWTVRAGASSFWTFQARPFDDFRSIFDDDLGWSIVYAHTLYADSGGGHRARWYVGPGYTNMGHSYGEHIFEVGVKAGVRMETKYFGTVNFYVIAGHVVQGWN